MMRINTNIVSQRTQENLRINQEKLSKSMNRLSSGKRINSSADDAAGLAVATRMEVKSSGLGIASRNSADAISMLETAEAAMNSVQSILQRMHDLALQAANGTYSDSDKALYQKEFKQLQSEIDHIAKNTNFNGIAMLSETNTTISIQASDQSGDQIALHFKGVGIDDLGVGSSINIGPGVDDMEAEIRIMESAMNELSEARADLGASLNRFEFNVTNLNNQQINTDAAASRIQDADMAAETSEMTKAKILSEASVSMLTQANQTPQMISKLLQ